MRAGYHAVALAVLGAVVLASLTGGTPSPAGPGPVAAALGLDGPDAPDFARRQALAVAVATNRCLMTRGLPPISVPDPPPAIPDADLDPVAWAARWGFGVSTSATANDDTDVVDPVPAYLATLGAREQARFRAALYGDGTMTGCHDQATASVFGLRDRLLAPVANALHALDAAIEADPGMAVVRRDWRSCVARATSRMEGDPAPAERATFGARILTAFAERTRAAIDDDAAMRGVQELERRVAVAVARCEDTFATSRARLAAPIEAAFVQRHREALARIGAAIRNAERSYPSVAP